MAPAHCPDAPPKQGVLALAALEPVIRFVLLQCTSLILQRTPCF